jgi:hypothetical protein
VTAPGVSTNRSQAKSRVSPCRPATVTERFARSTPHDRPELEPCTTQPAQRNGDRVRPDHAGGYGGQHRLVGQVVGRVHNDELHRALGKQPLQLAQTPEAGESGPDDDTTGTDTTSASIPVCHRPVLRRARARKQPTVGPRPSLVSVRSSAGDGFEGSMVRTCVRSLGRALWDLGVDLDSSSARGVGRCDTAPPQWRAFRTGNSRRPR